ncbi:hypothetical protein KR200_010109, partial [Drosophila serrata]
SYEVIHLPLPQEIEAHPMLKRTRFSKNTEDVQYIRTPAGSCVLHCGEHRYLRNASYKDKVYWKCSRWRKQCRSRVITHVMPNGQSRYTVSGAHNHL